MIILIAESKTMLGNQRDIGQEEFKNHTPGSEAVADEIMDNLSQQPVEEIVEQTKLSASLAIKLKKMAYDFRYKVTGYNAISAFTGVVFRSLDYVSLSEEGKKRCGRDVGLISSLYGWLRPLDIIKPYRLDFNARIEGTPTEGRSLWSFHRPEVTKNLVNTINAANESEILSLLPSDASKCVDWKLVKRFARVWKADFQEVTAGGTLKTPSASRLKTLRGLLLRQILEEGIREAADLLHTASDHYVCEGTPVYPDHLRFLC